MMAKETVENFKSLTDIAFKWGYLILFCLVFYFRSSFANKDEFNQLRDSVNLLIERQKHDEIQDRQILDLGNRVRDIELQRVAGDSRYNQAYPK
jgi:hypothetical protein